MPNERTRRELKRLQQRLGVATPKVATVIDATTRIRRLDGDLTPGLYLRRRDGELQRFEDDGELRAALDGARAGDATTLGRLAELGVCNANPAQTFCLACGHGYRWALVHLALRPDCAAATLAKLEGAAA